jgi:DNA (cytosine-5)-methyltransferase 1
MQNGALYQLPILVQTISVKEFGLEPNNETFFHTPNTTGLDGGSNGRKALKKRQESWPTPQARDHKGSSGRSNMGEELDLPTKVKMFPTPTSSEHKYRLHGESQASRCLEAQARRGELSFPKKVIMLPTPCNRDYKGAVKSGKRITKSGKTQNYGEQLPNVVGGQLNPTWVEWLMGWPVGWTDLKPLVMDKSLCVPQQHGSYLNE